jgi:hypothetical protein
MTIRGATSSAPSVFEVTAAKADTSTMTAVTDERSFVFMDLSERVTGSAATAAPRLLMGKAQ